ncbi:MAG TPA: amidase family protein, partial [Candidatus Melainabacteria bacterium]|nr:amidase family protein [Candidatus Melainabacteria bacterium]
YALSSGYYDAYYKKAQQVRRLIKESFDRTFERFDVLLSPTSPSTAFRIGEKVDDPLTMYLCDIATLPANLAGIPGLVLPCGISTEDEKPLPVGLQLLAGQLKDAVLIKSAFALEQVLPPASYESPVLKAAI